MKFKTTLARLTKQINTDGYTLLIDVDRSQFTLLDKLNNLCQSEKPLTVEIKQFRNKRSLDANAALWKMLSLMAEKLKTDKDELYLQMLERYGVFTHVIVKESAVKRVMEEWRTSRVLGEVNVNGKTGVQIQCYYGSSTYDKKEFSVLLEGVISEAKELGIDFISKEEQAILIQEWGNV